MDWAGDTLPVGYGYGCACGGACASCAASRDYGMDPITIGAIIAASATLIATGVGVGAGAISAKKQRDFAAQQAEKQRQHELKMIEEEKRRATEEAKRQEEAMRQAAALAPVSAPTPAPTTEGISTNPLLIGAAGALLLVYLATKD